MILLKSGQVFKITEIFYLRDMGVVDPNCDDVGIKFELAGETVMATRGYWYVYQANNSFYMDPSVSLEEKEKELLSVLIHHSYANRFTFDYDPDEQWPNADL